MQTSPLSAIPYYQGTASAPTKVVRFTAAIGIILGAIHLLQIIAGLVLMAGDITPSRFLPSLGRNPLNLISHTVAGGLALLLIASSIGCFLRKPMARWGLLIYAVLAILGSLFNLAHALHFTFTLSTPQPSAQLSGSDLLALIYMYIPYIPYGTLFPLFLFFICFNAETRRAFDSAPTAAL